MHADFWRDESTQRDRFFNPDNDIVSGTVLVVSQVMVKTQFHNTASFKQGDDLRRPVCPNPSVGSRTFIVQVDSHGVGVCDFELS